MSQSETPQVGSIGWIDLTVDNVDEVRDFYRAVTGWSQTEVDMGGYNDYCMVPPAGGNPVAGVCHARGVNVGMPAQWLIYITVTDVKESIAKCLELGGEVIHGPRSMGSYGDFCVIRDPAGAVAGLIGPSK